MPFPLFTARLAALLVLAAALVPCHAARAQPAPPGVDETFPAGAIAPSFLMNEAEAVVRLDSRRFEVESPAEAVTRVRRVVTVLGPDGRDYGRVRIMYNAFREIEDLDGRVLDAAGEEVRALGDEHVEDRSAISGYSLYEESRVRTAALYHDVYPYTVELEYEIAHDGLISWPTWWPQRTKAPVEHTALEIDAPQTLPARYAARHTGEETAVPAQPQTSDTGEGQRVYRWSAAALPPRARAAKPRLAPPRPARVHRAGRL